MAPFSTSIRFFLIFAMAHFALNCWGQLNHKQFTPVKGCSADQSQQSTDRIRDTDFVEIQSTSGCMDPCPIYTVRIQADGTVTWNGKQGVRTNGLATRHVSAQAASSLIDGYRATSFWCSRDLLGGGEDGPEVATTVHIGEYEETKAGIPDVRMFRAVGELAGTYSWIRGEPASEVIDGQILRDSFFAPKPGVTDLMRGASAGDLVKVQSELEAGSKVNERDSSGITALMYASLTPDKQVLNTLLKAGADPNIKSNIGQTALMAAATDWPAAIDKVQLLVAAGADLNAQDANGVSALMVAVGHRLSGRPERPVTPELISLLLKSGARRDLRDDIGQTATDEVASRLLRLDDKFGFVETFGINGKAEREAALQMRRDKLQQVQKLLASP